MSKELNDLEQMYLALEEYSLESGFFNYVGRKGIKLAVSIKKGFQHMISWNFDIMEDINPNATKLYLDRGVEYLDHTDLSLPKPFGLKVEMLDYSTVLLGRAVILNEIANSVLDETIRFVSDNINNRTLRSEKRFVPVGKLSIKLEDLKKDEAKYFVNTRQAHGLMKDLYNSFVDYQKTGTNILTVKETLKNSGPNDVKKKVDNLTLLVDALLKDLEIKKENSKENSSSEFNKHLIETLTNCAKCVEYYSLQLTRIIETNNCLYETEKIFMKL